ncbi:hypothetical protein GCM10011374_12010 [Kocuria dechangensis]|uniref:Uncharacterized protein n=1 Tax=Kocuria dechangensis TaxID=1176249 RepID=A0A917GM87_9MICC|nr:hypothetical protein GCM10011374_12010 [Kocuria dechangensis]
MRSHLTCRVPGAEREAALLPARRDVVSVVAMVILRRRDTDGGGSASAARCSGARSLSSISTWASTGASRRRCRRGTTQKRDRAHTTASTAELLTQIIVAVLFFCARPASGREPPAQDAGVLGAPVGP